MNPVAPNLFEQVWIYQPVVLTTVRLWMLNIGSIMDHAKNHATGRRSTTARHRLKPASVRIKPDESGCAEPV